MTRCLPWIFALLVAVACGEKEEPEVIVADGGAGFQKPDGVSIGDGKGTGSFTGGDGTDGATDGVAEDAKTGGGGDAKALAVPRVLSLSVTSGPAAGQTATVVVTAGFVADFRDSPPKVKFGGAVATQVEALSHGVIKLLTPAGPADTPIDVTVSADGQSDKLIDAFTYLGSVPSDYVLVTVDGFVGPSGSPANIPVRIELVGDVQPAALLVDVKVDLLELPVAGPTVAGGTVHTAAKKDIAVNAKKFDEVSILLLGKNRNLLANGTVATLIYSVPPAEAWSITPVSVHAEVVDPYGEPIEVVVQSGWLGVAVANEAKP